MRARKIWQWKCCIHITQLLIPLLASICLSVNYLIFYFSSSCLHYSHLCHRQFILPFSLSQSHSCFLVICFLITICLFLYQTLEVNKTSVRKWWLHFLPNSYLEENRLRFVPWGCTSVRYPFCFVLVLTLLRKMLAAEQQCFNWALHCAPNNTTGDSISEIWRGIRVQAVQHV